MIKGMGCAARFLVQIWDLTCATCWGELQKLSVPQFTHLWNGVNNNAYLTVINEMYQYMQSA